MVERSLAVVRNQREPRRDHALEATVLAAAMADSLALATVESLCTPAEFDHPPHAAIFESMRRLSAAKKLVDATTLMSDLAALGRLDAIGGEATLGAIAARTASVKNVEAHARRLIELSRARKLLAAARTIADLACNTALDINKASDDALTAVFEAVKQRSGGPVSLADALQEVGAATLNGVVEKAEGRRGIPTGYTTLDNVLAGKGLRGGRLYVLGAPPGTGKSALALNIMKHVAKGSNPVLFFSLEMPRAEVVGRFICIEGGIDGMRYEANEMTHDEILAMSPAMARLDLLPIHIDARPEPMSITQIRAVAMQHQLAHGLKLIVVDYLQIVDVPGVTEVHTRTSMAVTGLTALSRELNVPVIAISSLNRPDKTRKDKRPQMGDLFGSSRIESDAALVAFLYRDELYNRDTDDRGIAEVIIRKQRQGPIPDFPLRLKFEKTTLRFDDVPADDPPPYVHDTRYETGVDDVE